MCWAPITTNQLTTVWKLGMKTSTFINELWPQIWSASSNATQPTRILRNANNRIHALILKHDTCDTYIFTHQHLNTYATQLSSFITAFWLHFLIKLSLENNLPHNLKLLAKFRSTTFPNHREHWNLKNATYTYNYFDLTREWPTSNGAAKILSYLEPVSAVREEGAMLTRHSVVKSK